MSGHNKKRNPGLIVEFLMKKLSDSMVCEDSKSARAATKLLRKRVHQGSELYREYKVISSLVNSTVPDEATAFAVLREARESCTERCDRAVLESEMSRLIAEVNREGLNDDGCFYDAPVSRYRCYAAASQLINEWRRGVDPVKTVQLEQQLARELTSSKVDREAEAMQSLTAGEARLLVKVSLNKLNEKYGDSLSGEQKKLLGTWLTCASEDFTPVRRVLVSVKENLERATAECASENVSAEKIREVKDMLARERPEVEPINEETIRRFMNYSAVTAALEESAGGDK